MQLKLFIKEALLNIVDGITEANAVHNRFKILGVKHESGLEGAYADFDVSVMVNETTSGGAEGNVSASLLNVVSIKVNSDVDASSSHQNTHRISFKVYITANE
ncbi:MAG: hypothetical protein PHI63_04495 [Patescibacteria group bacterium]|nr:hypothetical protein [Patescibacteria group bacterium]